MDSGELENICFDEIKTKLIRNTSKLNDNDKITLSGFDALGLKFKNHFCLNNFAGSLFDENKKISLRFFQDLKLFARSNVSLLITSETEFKNTKDSYKNKTIFDIKESMLDIHSYGTKVFLTLSIFRGRKHKHSSDLFCYSPTLINRFDKIDEYSMPIFDNKLKQLAKSLSYGAEFARKTNFDGIVLDASLRNLLGEMTSKEFNNRKLGYFMEHYEYAKLCIENIKKESRGLPILLKISPFSFFSELFYKKDILSLKGIKMNAKNDIFDNLKKFVALGIDGFLFEFGSFENQFLYEFSPIMDENIYSKFYKEINKYFDDNNIKNRFDEKPLIICSDNFGRFNLETSDEKKIFDITKEIYADESFIDKIYNKKPVRTCIRCGHCKECAEKNNKVECAINPSLFEKFNPIISNNIQNVAVVGSGISGLVTSITLAKRGYKVTLFEKNNQLNKIGILSEVFGFDKRLKSFNNYLESVVINYVKKGNIEIKLNTRFSAENSANYDVVVLATGFNELFLNISGAVLKNVVSIYDLLDKKIGFDSVRDIVILAESELSLKTALYLAENHKKVTIIIEDNKFLNEIPTNLFSYYMITFEMLKVNVFVNSKIKVIHNDFVEIICSDKRNNNSNPFVLYNIRMGKIYKKQPRAMVIDCDLFVYEPKTISNNRLFYDCVMSNYSGKLFMVGDCLKISSLSDEIKSAYFVANNI